MKTSNQISGSLISDIESFFHEATENFHPITYGGGGFLTRTIRLLTITLKRLNLAPSNLLTFSFNLLVTFWQNSNKINSPPRGGGGGGVCCSCFEMRRFEQLKIYIFCFI